MRWLKRALTRNLLLKFTALVCAVVLWVYVDSLVCETRKMTVEVGGIQISATDLVVPRVPLQVALTVRGPKRLVQQMGPEEIRCTARTDVYSDENSISATLSEQDFTLPHVAGLFIVEIEPRTVHLLREWTEKDESGD